MRARDLLWGKLQEVEKMPNFKTTIGLEIHVQLATASKMFCRCNNEAFGKNPNTTVCPVCLGMPGMLPVANKQAIEWTVKTGLALNCQINPMSKFDRKHYFYPDLPKGYQISQYDVPLCKGGYLEIDGHKIRLNRIHLEEDAGKLIHKDSSSLVDLNRAGTPLMEIVTEPDIGSPTEAAEFMRQLQKIVRDVVPVSEASMEKGHLRCDANIDIKDGTGKMSEIVEIKNLNSFRFVEKALAFEEKRLQEDHLLWPDFKAKITRGFDSKKGITFSQRIKEEAADYRYFPEPDLPPIDTTKFDFKSLKSNLAENEEQKINKLTAAGVNPNDAKVLVQSMKKYDIYQKLSSADIKPKFLAKIVVHNYFGIDIELLNNEKIKNYQNLIKLLADNKISKNQFSEACKKIHQGVSYNIILSDLESAKESRNGIGRIIDQILSLNTKEVERYRAGEKQLLGFFIGQVLKKSDGRVDPKVVREEIIKKLEK